MSTKKFKNFIDASRQDIWRYFKLFNPIERNNQISSEQNKWTRIEEYLVGTQNKTSLWVKHEDESITGSHKFRGLTYQLSSLLDRGIKQAVLSSSGNAAISASRLIANTESKLKLFVFLSRKTPPEKLAAIQHSSALIPILSSRPLRLAKYAAKHFKLKDLRPSVDPNSRIGFRSLGFEIFEQKPEIDNIFSFATSFASVQGIMEAYDILKNLGEVKKVPRLFAVKSSGQLAGSLNPSVQASISKSSKDKQNVESIPDCKIQNNCTLVDISDDEITSCRQKYSQCETSIEGIASLIAAEKIRPEGTTLVILTGKNWKEQKPDLVKFKEAENFKDVDKIINQYA